MHVNKALSRSKAVVNHVKGCARWHAKSASKSSNKSHATVEGHRQHQTRRRLSASLPPSISCRVRYRSDPVYSAKENAAVAFHYAVHQQSLPRYDLSYLQFKRNNAAANSRRSAKYCHRTAKPARCHNSPKMSTPKPTAVDQHHINTAGKSIEILSRCAGAGEPPESAHHRFSATASSKVNRCINAHQTRVIVKQRVRSQHLSLLLVRRSRS